MHITPITELKSRLSQFQKKMQESDLEAALIIEHADLFYFSGTAQKAFLFVPAEGSPLLMVKRGWEQVQKESSLKELIKLPNMRGFAPLIKEHYGRVPVQLGMELDVLPTTDYFFYQKLFPETKIIDCSQLIKQVRMIKTAYEQELFRKTAALHQNVFYRVAEVLEEGMRDIELTAELEKTLRRQGHMGLIRFRGLNLDIFFMALLVGENTSVPTGYELPLGGSGVSPAFPMGVSGIKIKRNEPVVLDCGSNYYGYIIDQTRVYVLGKLSENLRRAHEVSTEILAGIRERGKAGVLASELYDWAYAYARKAGFEENFMGFGPNRLSFIGHGVGLELNEIPVLAARSNWLLEEGMVIAVEPKFVLPGVGGVGTEDTLLVTSKGMEPFTDYFPNELVTL